MTEQQEDGKDSFSALSPARKVLAVLASAKEPLSKAVVFKVTGITDPAYLSAQERKNVGRIFAQCSPSVIGGVQGFMMPEGIKGAVLERLGVDNVSVRAKIAQCYSRK